MKRTWGVGKPIDMSPGVVVPAGWHNNAAKLGLAQQVYGQMLAAYGYAQLTRYMGYRGECEVCSVPDQTLHRTVARASCGADTHLSLCWDCRTAVYG